MKRKEVLLRIHRTLLARREALRSAIREQMEGMRLSRGGADPADAASHAAHEAVNSELVDLESRELAQVERALEKIRNGTYGICEGCGKKIQIARLNALPYSTYCIACQREYETSSFGTTGLTADWDRVREFENRDSDEDINLSDLEMDMTRSG